jgi:hypothetical protein
VSEMLHRDRSAVRRRVRYRMPRRVMCPSTPQLQGPNQLDRSGQSQPNPHHPHRELPSHRIQLKRWGLCRMVKSEW